MTVGLNEPIVEEESVVSGKPDLSTLKRMSILCSIGLHRWTRWSAPYPRKLAPGWSVFTGAGMTSSDTDSETYRFQLRECRGCGCQQERSL